MLFAVKNSQVTEGMVISMGKQEFLDKLRLALNGRVRTETVSETTAYYEDYINTEVRKGRSEEEVMSSLGDPRLIARTIIETNGGESQDVSQEYGEEGEVEPHRLAVPGWVWLIAILVVAVVILSIVFKILSVLFPFILVMLVVSFLIKYFRDHVG